MIGARISSLIELLTDPRTTHELYRPGDVLMHAGTPCDVERRLGNKLVLRPHDGGPVRIALDGDCEPAAIDYWPPK